MMLWTQGLQAVRCLRPACTRSLTFLRMTLVLMGLCWGQVAAVPLTSRIHEGLVFSNRDSKTLLDKLVALLLSITLIWNKPVVLVADAYYASPRCALPD